MRDARERLVYDVVRASACRTAGATVTAIIDGHLN